MAGTPDPSATTASGAAVEANSTATNLARFERIGAGSTDLRPNAEDAESEVGEADAAAEGLAANPVDVGPEADARGSLVGRLAALRLALAVELAAVSWSGLSGRETVAVLSAMEDLGRSVDGARVLVASEVSARSAVIPLGQSQPELPWAFGCRDGAELITRATRISVKETRRRTRLGDLVAPRRSLGEVLPPLFPTVAAALTAGELGVEAAEVIATGLDRISARVAPDDLHTAERALVACATGAVTEETAGLPGAGLAFGADLLRGIVSQWQARLDPDGVAPTDPILEARSSVGFGPLRDGLYPLRGGVTPELRGIMNLLFDAFLSARARPSFPSTAQQTLPGEPAGPDAVDLDAAGPDDSGRDASGLAAPADQGDASMLDGVGDGGELGVELPAGIGDDRTGGEKRADILRAVFDQAARDPGTPTMGGAAPTVLVHVNATDLRNGTGVGWIDGVDAPVSLTAVKQAICAGGSQPVIFGPNQEVLTLGRAERLFSRAQRRALAARDGGCVIPGCKVPAHWAEAHHVIPWAAGGRTDLDNGVLLCWFHHHTIATSGWQIRMLRGTPQVKAPPWYDPGQTWHSANQHRARTASLTRTRG